MMNGREEPVRRGMGGLAVPAAVLGLAVAALIIYVFFPRGHYAGSLLEEGRLEDAAVLSSAESPGSRVHELALEGSDGLKATLSLRIPGDGEGPWPAAVLLGGWRTGRKALEKLPPVPWVIAAVDYPYEGPTRLDLPEGLLLIPKMRASLLDAPAAAIMALEYLEGLPEVDRDRTVAVGISLGAPVALAAAAADGRFEGLVFGYGGPDVISWTSEQLRSRMPAGARHVVAAMAAVLTIPLHPRRNVGPLGHRPVLVVAGREDTTVDHKDIEDFYAALAGPKRLVWLPGGHVRLRDGMLIADIINAIEEWAPDLPTREASAAGPLVPSSSGL